MAAPYLLVIDEHEDSRIIVRTIAQHGGFEVGEARHGREGFQLAMRRRPDVVVLDLELRLLPASQLLAMLRTEPDLKHVPVIALSPNQDLPDLTPIGVSGVVYKPLAISALLSELRRLTRPLDA